MLRKTAVRITIAVIICAAVAYAGAACYIRYFANNAYTSSLYVRKLVVTNDRVCVEGDTAASAEGYKGFSYSIRNNGIYIRPRYFIGGSGMFDIVIKADMRGIGNIYLQGADDTDIKLIWHRTDKE